MPPSLLLHLSVSPRSAELYCIVLYCTVLNPRAVQAAISPAGSYYFYAAVAVAAALLGLTVLPETKVRHSNLYNDI